VVGPSSVAWEGDALVIRVDERTVPFPSRVHGVVRVHPAALVATGFALDAAGRHRWRPLAPCARVEVALEQPGVRWAGAGYLDSNAGDEPLEAAFSRWDWSRADRGAESAVLYDVTRRAADALPGDRLSLALRFARSGAVEAFEPPPARELPPTFWRVARATRADAGTPAAVVRTLEDTPFYARSLLSTRLLGTATHAVHESLSLDRFRTRWVQCLLPFRMPRVAGPLG
jgi:carotenoid 1,2-hydratase